MDIKSRASGRVLIVDDDAILASLYRIKLRAVGFEVEVADSGGLGLQKIRENRPDLVVLDLMLGDMNGVEVLEQLRREEATRTMPIVVFSSAYMGGHIEAAKAAGATKCLYKGNTPPNRLVDELQMILNPSEMANQPDLSVSTESEVPASAEPATPAPPAPPPKTSGSATPPPIPGAKPAFSSLPHDEVQGNLRRELLAQIDERVSQAPKALADWLANPKNFNAPYFGALYSAIRSIAAGARLAGRRHMQANLAGALEVLLKDTKRNPADMTPSLGNTVSAAVNLLPRLVRIENSGEIDTETPPLIVVVDDDELAREVAAASLERAHLRAICIGSAEAALQLFEWNRIDLAIVDIEMPGMRGTDLVRRIRGIPLNSGTPVVFLTGRTDVARIAEDPIMAPADYLIKPIPAMELAVKALTTLYETSTATSQFAENQPAG